MVNFSKYPYPLFYIQTNLEIKKKFANLQITI